jgi:lysophospholipase L1-like esterase
MKTIVFFGDSITEGRIGASYVARLSEALAGQARVVNAGLNGDTVVNLRRRVARDVRTQCPDIVVVMVGLNDIGTVYALPLQRAYYRVGKGVWTALGPRAFACAYRRLLAELRRQTRAQIVLATPSALTEAPDDPVQGIVDAYAHIVRALAAQERLALIDVRAAFADAIRADPRPGQPYHILTAVRDMWAVRRGRATYPDLTRQRGYRLLCDGAHLADAGADLVAATMLAPLRALLER